MAVILADAACAVDGVDDGRGVGGRSLVVTRNTTVGGNFGLDGRCRVLVVVVSVGLGLTTCVSVSGVGFEVSSFGIDRFGVDSVGVCGSGCSTGRN
ncbi:hypothetical protein ACWDPV_10275 [Gordonia sp. NPDC003504]